MQVFFVTYTNIDKYWLGGTVWRFDQSRATPFKSRIDAQAALDKASKFMKAAVYKRAVIEEITVTM